MIIFIRLGVNFLWQSKKQEQINSNTRAIQEQIKSNTIAIQEQIKSNTRANQEQYKRGDILPVIMLFFKSSHQFLYRSKDIRTNVSITLFFLF
jgi:vacuolar-type H+-ATPase subunit F/Vma7